MMDSLGNSSPQPYDQSQTDPSVEYSTKSELLIAKTTKEFSSVLADEICDTAREAIRKGEPVLILVPTGSTPIGVYKEIVQRFNEDPTLDFSKTIFFNLDEYALPDGHPQGYDAYMRHHLIDALQSDPARSPLKWYIPKPPTDLNDPEAQAAAVEQVKSDFHEATKIAGGEVALAFIGAGPAYPDYEGKLDTAEEPVQKGLHVGFNEPGSLPENPSEFLDDIAKWVFLSPKTIKDASYRFQNLGRLQEEGVLSGSFSSDTPTEAITLGVGAILRAKKVVLAANGEEKAPVVKRLRESGKFDPNFPGTVLTKHPHLKIVVDTDASHQLSEVSKPWREEGFCGPWTDELHRQLVVESLKERKPHDSPLESIYSETLHITDWDSLQGLRLDEIFQKTKRSLERSIHSDSKIILPMAGDKVLISSPHPDDDAICCAAVIRKMQELGAKVHIAYQTNGEVAVRDSSIDQRARAELGIDAPSWRLKGRTRQLEALDAERIMSFEGTSAEITFQNFDAYIRRGQLKLRPLSEKDISKTVGLLDYTRPNFIFYSAENDSHGTHGTSAKAIAISLKQLMDKAISEQDIEAQIWLDELELWGYRGAYAEHNLYEDPDSLVVVPFDETVWQMKNEAILAHRSQAGIPLFPSYDPRPFNKRAEDRYSTTGKVVEGFGWKAGPNPAGQTYAEVFRRLSLEQFLNSQELG